MSLLAIGLIKRRVTRILGAVTKHESTTRQVVYFLWKTLRRCDIQLMTSSTDFISSVHFRSFRFQLDFVHMYVYLFTRFTSLPLLLSQFTFQIESSSISLTWAIWKVVSALPGRYELHPSQSTEDFSFLFFLFVFFFINFYLFPFDYWTDLWPLFSNSIHSLLSHYEWDLLSTALV